jgi:hypothetical protein
MKNEKTVKPEREEEFDKKPGIHVFGYDCIPAYTTCKKNAAQQSSNLVLF